MTQSRHAHVALLPLLLILSSCGTAKVSEPPAKKQAESSTIDFSQPLVASALRERAIRTIEESADSVNPSIRANAIEAAGKSAQRFRPLIERGLTDPNLGVRAVAAMTIAKKKLSHSAPR